MVELTILESVEPVKISVFRSFEIEYRAYPVS